MGGIVKLVVFWVVMIGCCLCQESTNGSSYDSDAGVYMVTLKQAPSVFRSYRPSRVNKTAVHPFGYPYSASGGANTLENPSFGNITKRSHHHQFGSRIARVHDSLLKRVLKGEKYMKLYSYHYLINGFAVLVTPQQLWFDVYRNHGIPVVVAGHHFGNASGMAPRAHIAVYKALYKSFGGFAADVVAAID
ncbi:hypothetical protein M8C21_014644, partial [Ambrosia artemisiifolia]